MATEDPADKDRDLSFSIVNYLSASYRGKLAGYTLLGQLEYRAFDPDDLSVLQKNTDRIAEWFNGMTRGEALFCASWNSLETFEAQNAFAMLLKLKPDLQQCAERIETFLNGLATIDSESAKYLFGMLTRSAFARDIYLRGFVIFGQTYNKQQIVENYSGMLRGAIQQSAFIQQGINVFQEAKYNLAELGEQFANTLLSSCDELPSIFRTHVHDINLLAANFQGGLTFENLDFSEEEGKSWTEIGIRPDHAGYWRAYGFNPTESITWVQSLVYDPGEAAAWKTIKFSADTAKEWKEAGFSFEAAQPWIQAGYVAKIAKEHIAKGITTPPNPS